MPMHSFHKFVVYVKDPLKYFCCSCFKASKLLNQFAMCVIFCFTEYSDLSPLPQQFKMKRMYKSIVYKSGMGPKLLATSQKLKTVRDSNCTYISQSRSVARLLVYFDV